MTTDVHCRLMITRGIKSNPSSTPDCSRSGPTVVIVMEHSRPAGSLQEDGIRLATVPQVADCHVAGSEIHSHSKLNCVIACLQAEQAGAEEGLMLDPHGFVNTTNACNFFIVRSNEVWTSTGDYCMNGITRGKVINLCRSNGIPVFEKNFSLYEAYSADEVFLTAPSEDRLRSEMTASALSCFRSGPVRQVAASTATGPGFMSQCHAPAGGSDVPRRRKMH